MFVVSWLFALGAGAELELRPRGWRNVKLRSQACLWHPPEVTGHGILDSREAGNSYQSQEHLQQSGNDHVEGVQLPQLTGLRSLQDRVAFLHPPRATPCQPRRLSSLGWAQVHLTLTASLPGLARTECVNLLLLTPTTCLWSIMLACIQFVYCLPASPQMSRPGLPAHLLIVVVMP